MGGPLSSATTWSCQSPKRTHDMMTKRGGLNAQGCLCMERDMPKRCLERSYLRGTLMGRNVGFLQCSAGRWPKLCQPDNHLSAQHEDSFCSQISQGGASFSWTGFFLDWIDWKWLIGKKFDLTGKFRKEWESAFLRPLMPYKWCSRIYRTLPHKDAHTRT